MSIVWEGRGYVTADIELDRDDTWISLLRKG